MEKQRVVTVRCERRRFRWVPFRIPNRHPSISQRSDPQQGIDEYDETRIRTSESLALRLREPFTAARREERRMLEVEALIVSLDVKALSNEGSGRYVIDSMVSMM